MVQVVLIAGGLVGGLAAQTRYVPDKVGEWTLRPPEYSAGKDQYGLSPAEKSRFEAKIGALISTIQQSKVFNPPMGIEPQVIARYYAKPFSADDPDLCEIQPCASHPPGFYFYILEWYYVLTEPKDRLGHIDYQAPLVVGLVDEPAQEVWVAVNNLTRTLGDLPWAAPRRLPDGRQIRYLPRETAARVGGFPVYENHLGDHLVLTKRDRAPWMPVTREQFVLVLIGERERLMAHQAEEEKKLPPCDKAYKDWIAGADERRKMNEKAYQILKQTNPADAERFRTSVEKTEADMPAGLKKNQALCEADRKWRAEHTADVVLEHLRAELARMTPAERASPAWYDSLGEGPDASGLVAPDAPRAVELVTTNPDFYDRSRSRTDFQVISVDIEYDPSVGADHANLRQDDLPDWRMYEFLTTTDWQRVAALLD
jgi:hypothetical protein